MTPAGGRRGPRGARRRAFTLLELLVVLVIVSVVSAWVVPRMLASLPGVELKSAARAVASSLRYARSQAVFETTPYAAAVDGPRGLLVVAPLEGPEAPERRRVYELPDGIEARVVDGEAAEDDTGTERVLFFPRGDSSGGRVVLRDPRQREYAIAVDPITGTVEVVRP